MLHFLLNKVIRKLAGVREENKLLIFNFHNIEDKPSLLSDNSTSYADFKKQVHWINQNFNILPLDEGINLSRSAKLMEPTACITLDDGYNSQYKLAKPLFDQLNIPSTFFVSSGHIKGLLWNDHIPLFFHHATEQHKQFFLNRLHKLVNGRDELAVGQVNTHQIDTQLKYLPIDKRTELLSYMVEFIPSDAIKNIMLTEAEVCEIAGGNHAIGAHTYNHPILAIEKDKIAQEEINRDITQITHLIDKPVELFAYPNGKPMIDYSDRDIQILIKSNIKYAVTTEPGYFSPGSDPMQIPRVNLSGNKTYKYYKTVISAYQQLGKLVESRGYEKTC